MKNRGGLKSGGVKRIARKHPCLSTSGCFFRPYNTTLGRFALALTLAPSAYAAPVDGTIISGNATITQPTGDHTVIHQTTDKAIINWRDFSISADEHTQFIQPNAGSITLNRVTGSNPSEILGRLTANGNILLINPNGIMFGANSRVDVGGLIATTADLTNDDFNNGNYRFNTPGKPDARIKNHGDIIARTGGNIALVAPFVSNHGTIRAHLGKVQLAAGNTWALDMGGLVKLAVNDSTASELLQAGLIEADGGTITLTTNAANDLLGNTINVTGTTRARTVGLNRKGNIVISGNNVKVASNAKLDANATQHGDGGTITILSDKNTQFLGHASARGGEFGGNGGFIEVSSSGALDFRGKADTFSPYGHNGTLLLDPTDLTISNSTGSGIINIATLQNMLTNNNVTLQTATSGSGNGDITVVDAISWGGDNTLMLQAHRDININGSIRNNGSGSLILNATNTANSNIRINNIIDVGGDLTLRTRTLDITRNISGRGILNLLPNSVSTSIGLGTAIGTFNLGSNELENILPGWAEVRLGQTNSNALTTLNTTNWQNNLVFNTRAELAGEINTFGHNITFNKDAVLNNDTTLKIGSGTSTFNGTLNSTTPKSFTITGDAGSKAVFNNSVGTTNALNNLTITADDIALANYLNGTGTLTLQQATDTTTAGIGDNASGTFHLSTTELSNISSAFSNVVIGRSTSTAKLDLQDSTWQNPVTFRGNITAGGNITTQNHALTLLGNSTVNTGTAATFNTGTATFTNAGIFNSFGDLTIVANDVNLSGNLSGSGTLTLQPSTPNRAITLGANAANTLQLTADKLNRILSNWKNIILRASTINVAGTSSSGSNNITLQADNLNLQAALTGTGNLTIKTITQGTTIGLGNNARGTLRLDDIALSHLTPGWANIFIGDTTSGNIDLRSTTWTSPVTFGQHVTLFADTTLNTNNLTFAETLNGNRHNLNIAAGSGTVTFTKAVSNLGSGAGSALNIINAGLTQAFDTFSAFSGLSINSNSLWKNNITTAGNSTFNGHTTFAGLGFDGQGTLNFNGDVVLTDGPTAITNRNGDIHFASTITGPYNFSVNAGGHDLTFKKTIDAANLNIVNVDQLNSTTLRANSAHLSANHINADVDMGTLSIAGQSATLTGRVGHTKSQQAMANNVIKTNTPGPNAGYTLNSFEIGTYNPAEEADTSKIFQLTHPSGTPKLPAIPAFDELALLITPAAGPKLAPITDIHVSKNKSRIIIGRKKPT